MIPAAPQGPKGETKPKFAFDNLASESEGENDQEIDVKNIGTDNKIFPSDISQILTGNTQSKNMVTISGMNDITDEEFNINQYQNYKSLSISIDRS